MNYSDLPDQERIEKAAEYATMLVSEERPTDEIVEELRTTFSLSHIQAEQAYLLMRTRHRAIYRAGIKVRVTNMLLALLVCGVIGVFYYFLAEDGGVFFYIIAGIFFFLLLGVIASIVFLGVENSIKPEKVMTLSRPGPLKERLNDYGSAPAVLLIMVVLAFILLLTRSSVIDPADLKTKEGLILSSQVTKMSGSGKRASRIYVFRFKNYPHQFRLEGTIYKYGLWSVRQTDFSVGDTLSVQFKNKYLDRINTTGEEERIYVVNIKHRGRWLVDHAIRNQQVHLENKRTFYFFLAAFILSIIGIYIWVKYTVKHDPVYNVPSQRHTNQT